MALAAGLGAVSAVVVVLLVGFLWSEFGDIPFVDLESERAGRPQVLAQRAAAAAQQDVDHLAHVNLQPADSYENVNEGADDSLPGQWQTLAGAIVPRQEGSAALVDGRIYALGFHLEVESYSPQEDSWELLDSLAPGVIHHVQAVVVDDLIYLVGGLSEFPALQVNSVFVYDPSTDTISRAGNMPAGRDRGAGGIAVHDGKIYYAGGLHDGQAVSWFDEYDPETGRWRALPDMPEPRDHFHAAIVDGVFYAIGGRAVDVDQPVDTDYSFTIEDAEAGWQELPESLPTKRGGFAIAVLDGEILVIGGENEDAGARSIHGTVEAFDPGTGSWRRLQNLGTARHGIQAVVCEGAVYVPTGQTALPGNQLTDTTVLEVFRGEDAGPCG
jgi:hypothetical protein